MKTLKFFLVAFIAISLFACEKDPVTDSGNTDTPKDTTGVENPKDTTGVENPAAISFSLKYDGKEIKDGDVIDVTMEHYAWGELVAHVYLTNNADDAKTFTAKEVRNYDYVNYIPSFGVTMCLQGNGEKEQLWEVGELASKQEQELAMHLKVSNYVEVDGEYTEVIQETATCPGVFTVSNGEQSVTFTLNFVYVKEEIPAE